MSLQHHPTMMCQVKSLIGENMKNKAENERQLILTFKRIIYLKYIYLFKTLQIQLLTSTSCKFSRDRQDPSSCFVVFKQSLILELLFATVILVLKFNVESTPKTQSFTSILTST